MKLEGEISEINVVERLVELGREQFTGAVRFENDGIIKIIYFKKGDVLSASTNDRADSVDEILLRGGKVTREHVKQALARRKENETLGDALLNLGFITRKELTWARRLQVIGVMRSVAAWDHGSYTIVADYLPKREEGTLFLLSQMLVEMIVTDTNREKIEEALEGGNAVFERTIDFETHFLRIGLNQDADEIVSHIDGRLTAGEIASASGKDEFNVYKLLHALATLGLLRRVDNVQGIPQVSEDAFAGPGEFDFVNAGVSDADDIWSDTPSAVAGTPEEPPTQKMPAAMAFGATEPLERPLVDGPGTATAPVSAFDGPIWDEAPVRHEAATAVSLEAWNRDEWGFDEAQIEAARRGSAAAAAHEPDPEPMAETVERASRPNRWVFALIAAAALVAVVIGGVAGLNWWQAKNAAKQTDLTPVAKAKSARRHQAATGTESETAYEPKVNGRFPVTSVAEAVTHPSGSAPEPSARPSATEAAALTTTAASTANGVAAPARGTTSTQSATTTNPAATSGRAPTTTAASASPATRTATAPAPAAGGGKPASSPGGLPAASQAQSASGPPPPALVQPRVSPSVGSVPAGAPAGRPGTSRVERTASGAAVMTNVPPATSAPSPVAQDAKRSHYDDMAKTFAAQANGAYTVQIELACQTNSITRAIQAGGSNIWFVPIHYRGNACYRVFWGHYASAAEARLAAPKIPQVLLSGGDAAVVAVPKP